MSTEQQTQPTLRRIWASNPGYKGGRRVLSPLLHPLDAKINLMCVDEMSVMSSGVNNATGREVTMIIR